MRVLHTADWHLGRSFHGEQLLGAQAASIDCVVQTAREARVDAVLVAGDVYDRALPPVDAVRLADEALRRISEVCPVVVISGNHDSAPRLGFGAALLARAGVHVRTAVAGIGTPVLLGGACVYAVPYLEPDLVRGELEAERGHCAVMAAALERVRADLAARPAGTPSIVVAHAFVAGAEPSDSERDLAVGGAASVPPAAFAGFDYVALGHLHGPQRVGRNGRYAGSPVAFSFSEARHAKSLAVVEVGGETELVPYPVARPLAALRGRLEELLADPAHAAAEQAWVQATLTDPVRPQDAMERLRRRFVHTVALSFEPRGVAAQAEGSYSERLGGLDDAGLVARFEHDVRGSGLDEAEGELLEEALTADRVRELSR